MEATIGRQVIRMNTPIGDVVAAKENTRNIRMNNSKRHRIEQRREVGRNDRDFKVGNRIMREGATGCTYQP